VSTASWSLPSSILASNIAWKACSGSCVAPSVASAICASTSRICAAESALSLHACVAWYAKDASRHAKGCLYSSSFSRHCKHCSHSSILEIIVARSDLLRTANARSEPRCKTLQAMLKAGLDMLRQTPATSLLVGPRNCCVHAFLGRYTSNWSTGVYSQQSKHPLVLHSADKTSAIRPSDIATASAYPPCFKICESYARHNLNETSMQKLLRLCLWFARTGSHQPY